MEQTSIPTTDKAKPKTSWIAIASFIMAIIGIAFRIYQFIIDDHTINLKLLEIDHFTLLKALIFLLIIINVIGFVLGVIAIKKTISNRWLAILGAFGNALAMHLFLVLMAGSGYPIGG
jgi:hypothetical protein